MLRTRWALRGMAFLLLIGLLIGAIALALHESQPATEIKGTLIAVDHSDGGDGGTGLSTVQFTGAAGKTVTAEVVIDLSSLSSQDPGTPVRLFERDGHAVDEPQPRTPTLLVRILQALIIWAVFCFAFGHLVLRPRA